MGTKAFEGVSQENGKLDTHINVVGTTAATDTVYNTTANSMTVSPETTAESGYIRVTINGTDYQIPIYAA